MHLDDTNVLLDLVTADPVWSAWSEERLEASASHGPLAINAVIYAELSIGFRTIDEVEAVVAELGLLVIGLSRAALFLAGKAFMTYRGRGG